MRKTRRSILSNILRKQMESLGYPSLRKFFFDHQEIGYSYELVRQVVYGGRVPRAEALLAILSALRFSPLQTRKVLELCFQGFGTADPNPRNVLPRVPFQEGGRELASPGTDEGGDARSAEPEASSRPFLPTKWEDPAEILSSLTRSLPRIPRSGNEDFWETIHALAGLAEKKAARRAKREADQPLLFGKEPEAIYHLLVRKGAVPSYMSKGESIPLAFTEGIEYRDRFRGALLGCAIGEVLGRFSQGLAPGDIQVLFGRIDSFPSRQIDGMPVPASLLLARVLLRDKAPDPQALASAYATESMGEAAANPEFSRNLLERGYPWFEAGTPEPVCAPAVRIVPLALLRAGDFRRLKLEAGIDAAITHPAPAAISGCIVQAAAVARLLHTPPDMLDVIGFSRSLAHAVSGIETDRGGRGKSGRPAPTLWRRLGTELTALLLRRAEIEEIRDSLGNGESVLEGIPFSWACFLRTPEDFTESVLSAVNLGNHAEGTGALTGGLAGAYRGVSGIPDRLLREFPWKQEAEAAADALLALSRRGATAS